MKVHQISVIFASLVFLSITPVYAEDGAPKTPSVGVDADGDGKVSYEECRASKANRTPF